MSSLQMDTPDDNDQIKDDHGRLPPPKVLLERERLARQELWSTTSLQATFLNENGTISAIDSFEQSLYIGFENGQLLHAVQLDNSLMLASSQRPIDLAATSNVFLDGRRAKSKRISTPRIHRICSFHAGTGKGTSSESSTEVGAGNSARSGVSFVFVHTELSPISNINAINGVRCFDVAEAPLKNGAASVIICGHKSIKWIAVDNQVAELQVIDYAATAVRLNGTIACVANESMYELLDISQKAKFSLLEINAAGAPASEDEGTARLTAEQDQQKRTSERTKVHPLVEKLNSEFLIVTATGSFESQSLGLFIDLEGQIVRNTIVFPEFPKAVCFTSTCVFAQMTNSIQMYNIMNQSLLRDFSVCADCIYAVRPAVTDSSGNTITVPSSRAAELAIVPLNRDANETEIQTAQSLVRCVPELFIAQAKSEITAIVVPTDCELLELWLEEKRVAEAVICSNGISQAQIEKNDDEKKRPSRELRLFLQKAFFKMMLSIDYAPDNSFAMLKKSHLDARLIVYLLDFVNIDQDKIIVLAGLKSTIATAHKSFSRRAKTASKSSFSVSNTEHTEICVHDHADSEKRSDDWLDFRDGLLQLLQRYVEYCRGNSSEYSRWQSDGDWILANIYETLGEREQLQTLAQDYRGDTDEFISFLTEHLEIDALSTLLRAKNRIAQLLQVLCSASDGANKTYSEKYEMLVFDILQNERLGEDDNLYWQYGLWLLQQNFELGLTILSNHFAAEQIVRVSRERERQAMVTEAVEATDHNGIRSETAKGGLGCPSEYRLTEQLLEHFVFRDKRHDPGLLKQLSGISARKVVSLLAVPNIREQAQQSLSTYRDMKPPKPSFPDYLHDQLQAGLQKEHGHPSRKPQTVDQPSPLQQLKADQYDEFLKTRIRILKLIEQMNSSSSIDRKLLETTVESSKDNDFEHGQARDDIVYDDDDTILGNLLATEKGLLPELMAALYSRSGQFNLAFEVLLDDLHDIATADNFCMFGGSVLGSLQRSLNETTKLRHELYQLLLERCITKRGFIHNEEILDERTESIERSTAQVPDQWYDYLEQVFAPFIILSRGRYLDIQRTIEIVPQDWLLIEIKQYIVDALRTLLALTDERTIVRFLENAQIKTYRDLLSLIKEDPH